jgi:hypothetical protein
MGSITVFETYTASILRISAGSHENSGEPPAGLLTALTEKAPVYGLTYLCICNEARSTQLFNQ